MSSWPPTLVDWGALTPLLRDGDTVCLVHGRVDAQRAPVGVPICPHCWQAVTVAHRDRQGVLRTFIEPVPDRCPHGHPLTGGQVLLSWQSCSCPPALPGPGGHRTWRCRICSAQDTPGRGAGPPGTFCWPPHSA